MYAIFAIAKYIDYLRINEQIASTYIHSYVEDKQKIEKKNFHLLNQDIVNTFNEARDNLVLQAEAIEESNENI